MESTGRTKRLPTLCAAEECTGCMGCRNACPHDAIGVREDQEGFKHPKVVAEKCVGCGLCERACPILDSKGLFDNEKEPKTYAAWALDERTRTTSSSGGLFSVFAGQTLREGGEVYGASIDAALNVKHKKATKVEELETLKGSKYAQSDIGETFGEIRESLKGGRKVLFTGTPCQVAGLKSFLGKDYPELLTIDIFCHGVPPVSFLKDSLRKTCESNPGTRCLTFRELDGWDCVMRMNGKKLEREESLYLYSFLKSLNFRESCYSCPFARVPRQGDVSLGDFWGLGKRIVFDGGDMRQGVSCVLVNNEKGADAFERVSDRIFRQERSLEEACVQNPNIYRASARPAGRDGFFQDFADMPRRDFIEKYGLKPKGPSVKKTVATLIRRLGLRPLLNRMKKILYRQ